jgi:Glycosyltransferase WbsX
MSPQTAVQPNHTLKVACYTFPHYHRSELSDALYAPGWTEYEVMRGCKPWFDGHDQPRVPLLGELDERSPTTWDVYGRLAVEHGIGVFIWDWYWYDGRPALHEALEEGFLRSKNCRSVEFSVMWTNHAWTRIYPTLDPDGRDRWEFAFPAPDESDEELWRSVTYLMSRYFHYPNYWRIGGKPVLCIWNTDSLRSRFGIEGTRTLLTELRGLARRMGHHGLHVHATLAGDELEDLEAMAIDSYGFYTSLSGGAGKRPESELIPSYDDVVKDVVERIWPEAEARSNLPFFPGISPGWDTSPRFLRRLRSNATERSVWPGTAYWGNPIIMSGETPAGFQRFVEAACVKARARVPEERIITIGCWNEWTEGHYMLPDTRFGYGMLRALKEGLTGKAREVGRDWYHGSAELKAELH